MPSARIKLGMLAACLVAVLVLPARAGALALDPVDTFSDPIYVTAPPSDSRLFVVEKGGTIQVLDNGTKTQFLDIHTQTSVEGERGLLSMAFDPHYASNGLFYVFYTDSGTAGGAQGEGRIDEFHISSNPDVADASSQRHVLTITRPNAAVFCHNGGQLQFGRDGYLYASVGDGCTGGATAQNPMVLNGKVLRIDAHQDGANPYTIPSDNPFVGSLSARNEIWAMGLRNPFRFSVDALDGALLIGDVGENSREEVDYSPPATSFGLGANYGWNCREGLIAGPDGSCSGNGGFTDPIFDYPHTDPGDGTAHGCAIIGGFVYRGSDIPSLSGRYLYMDLCTRELRSLVPGLPFAAGDRSEGVSVGTQPFSFGQDGRCELYLAAPPTVYKLVSSPGASPGSGGCARSAVTPVGGGNQATAPIQTKRSKRCKDRKTKRKRRQCRRKQHKQRH